MTLDELKNALALYQLEEGCSDDEKGLRCCELAYESLQNGCYGVGALLFNTEGEILIEARNEVFLNGFYSDRHAEMVALNLFEQQYPNYGDRNNLTLMVSLEPCPMCLTRLLLSGVGRVCFLAHDNDGGMVNRMKQMPPVWQNLAELQKHHHAQVSPKLLALASQLALCHLDQLRKRLVKAVRGT